MHALPALGERRLDELEPADITNLQQLLRRRELKGSTIDRVTHSALRGMLRDAHLLGYRVVNLQPLYDPAFVQRLAGNSPEPDIDPYIESERDRIIEGVLKYRRHYHAFVFFRFWTGTRPSEALGLRRGRLDLHRSLALIRVSRVLGRDGEPKTRKTRRDVVLHENVVTVLRDVLPTHPAHDDLVFTTPGGAPIDETNFYQREWVPMLRRLGIRPRPFYNTRHTYISFMLAIGAPPLWVARQTGTSLAMIEKHYGRSFVAGDQLDALISDAAARPLEREPSGNLAPVSAPPLLHGKEKPRVVGALCKSGRPGSNRRRPAWEAAKGLAEKAAKSLRKCVVLSS